MYDHIAQTHTFCAPRVRETWRHGAQSNRGLLAPALPVRPQVHSHDSRA
jgi:hypothetical protein